MERTLVLIKPDGMEKKLTGALLATFEKNGLKLAGIKMVKADILLLSKHYPEGMALALGEKTKASYLAKGKPFNYNPNEFGISILKKLRDFIQSSPIVAIVLEGENAVAKARKLVGGTEPITAGEGTIRHIYSDDSYERADKENRPIKNIVHASGTIDEAKKEIEIWFKEAELFKY